MRFEAGERVELVGPLVREVAPGIEIGDIGTIEGVNMQEPFPYRVLFDNGHEERFDFIELYPLTRSSPALG